MNARFLFLGTKFPERHLIMSACVKAPGVSQSAATILCRSPNLIFKNAVRKKIEFPSLETGGYRLHLRPSLCSHGPGGEFYQCSGSGGAG
jgi:hypothetical protein